MDSEKLKLITEDSETMIKTLKDFNKYNKKYNEFQPFSKQKNIIFKNICYPHKF